MTQTFLQDAIPSEAVFRFDGERIVGTPHAIGPWSAFAQHGSAPAALIAWAAERLETATPMRVARLTIDLIRPVPIGALDITSSVVRDGWKIQLVEICLVADGITVVRATVLKISTRLLDLPVGAEFSPLNLRSPDECSAPDGLGNLHSPFLDGISMRVAAGGLKETGPAAVWVRSDRTLIEGQITTPLMRAALTADFCNGVSALLDFDCWTFISCDISLTLARDPIGEWILVDAQTWIDSNGGGVAFARLGDRRGWFGRAAQSLLVERRATEKGSTQ